MSKLEVDKITPQSGTTLTIGDSGDTIVIDSTSVSGAKLAAPTLVGSASSAGSILFKEDTDNGTNAVTLIGPAATADVTLTLPAATDTVVGRQTTDTLTNKTINASQLVNGSIATGKLADDAVTYAKMQDTSTANRVLGAASAGTIGEVQVVADMVADNAITLAKMASGTDGNIISYDTSGNPVAVATGNDGQVLTSAGAGAVPAFETLSVTPADNSITTAQLAYNPNAFRNIIINGDMNVCQRATSSTGITSDGYYTVDRFLTEMGSFGTWTQSQYADAPSGQGFNNSLKMDCTTANGSLAANVISLVGQSVEGRNLQAIKQGTANAQSTTLSFWHKHTKTGTNIVELLDADNANAVSGAYTQSVSNTWEKATITFPANTSGTYGNDNARSLRIRFIMGAGSDTTSGTLATTWQTSITNANRYVGQVNNADSTSNNFIITGVQYEVATVASEFELLPFDINLRRCQRYYQKTFEYSQTPVDNAQKFEYHFIENYDSTQISGLISYYLIEMRATPTVTVYTTGQSANGTGKITFYGGGSWGNAAASVQAGSTTKCVNFDSSFTNVKLAQFNYEASAEL
jgi:hypothetical protein